MTAQISFEAFEFKKRSGEIFRMKGIVHVKLLVGGELVT